MQWCACAQLPARGCKPHRHDGTHAKHAFQRKKEQKGNDATVDTQCGIVQQRASAQRPPTVHRPSRSTGRACLGKDISPQSTCSCLSTAQAKAPRDQQPPPFHKCAPGFGARSSCAGRTRAGGRIGWKRIGSCAAGNATATTSIVSALAAGRQGTPRWPPRLEAHWQLRGRERHGDRVGWKRVSGRVGRERLGGHVNRESLWRPRHTASVCGWRCASVSGSTESTPLLMELEEVDCETPLAYTLEMGNVGPLMILRNEPPSFGTGKHAEGRRQQEVHSHHKCAFGRQFSAQPRHQHFASALPDQRSQAYETLAVSNLTWHRHQRRKNVWKADRPHLGRRTTRGRGRVR
jgi:hypothetical protein